MGRIQFAEPVTLTVRDLADEGQSIAQELRDELQSWYDNLPENLQGSSKGEALQEAISQLDSFADDSLPDLPEGVEDLEGVYRPIKKKKMSRSNRRDDGSAMFDAAAAALREYVENQENLKEEDQQAIEEVMEELERWRDEFDAVEFPGMF